MPGSSEFLYGRPQQVQQLSTKSPQQQQVISQILGQLGPALQQSNFGGIEQEARRGLKEQTIPTIMERLTSMGGARSSAMGQQTLAAAAGLESQLGALRSQHQQQQLQQLLSAGLQSNQENLINPEQQGFLQKSATSLGGGLATGLGGAAGGALGGAALGMFGGPVGVGAGAGIGAGLGGLLSLLSLLKG